MAYPIGVTVINTTIIDGNGYTLQYNKKDPATAEIELMKDGGDGNPIWTFPVDLNDTSKTPEAVVEEIKASANSFLLANFKTYWDEAFEALVANLEFYTLPTGETQIRTKGQ